MLKKIATVLLAICILTALAYVNAVSVNTKQLSLREETFLSGKIDEDTDGLLIAYFSDLDYGRFIDRDFLDKTIEKIALFQPDIILFGGDLFDISVIDGISEEDLDYLASSLNSLKARFGKYAVYGDDDLRVREKADYVYSNSGFKILDNRSQSVSIDRNSSISLIGIAPAVEGSPDPVSSFSGNSSAHYTIVLSHCPDLFDDLREYEYDYFLSGHSRGGQINLPLISLFGRPEGCRKYYFGKITRNGKTLDITNGIGRIETDARFLADAEVVFYTLRSQTEEPQ